MKIYILQEDVDIDENKDIVGVYYTLEKAKAIKETEPWEKVTDTWWEATGTDKYATCYSITEWELE